MGSAAEAPGEADGSRDISKAKSHPLNIGAPTARVDHRLKRAETTAERCRGMQLSPLPDLSSNRRLAVTALVVALAVAGVMVWQNNDVASTLGDTDDARKQWETELTLKPEDNEGVNDQREAQEELAK